MPINSVSNSSIRSDYDCSVQELRTLMETRGTEALEKVSMICQKYVNYKNI